MFVLSNRSTNPTPSVQPMQCTKTIQPTKHGSFTALNASLFEIFLPVAPCTTDHIPPMRHPCPFMFYIFCTFQLMKKLESNWHQSALLRGSWIPPRRFNIQRKFWKKLFENIRGRGFLNLATMILPDLGGISVFACWDRVFEFQTQGSIPKRQRIDLTHLLTFLSIYVQMTLKFSNFLSFIFITLTLKGFPQARGFGSRRRCQESLGK